MSTSRDEVSNTRARDDNITCDKPRSVPGHIWSFGLYTSGHIPHEFERLHGNVASTQPRGVFVAESSWTSPRGSQNKDSHIPAVPQGSHSAENPDPSGGISDRDHGH